MCRDLLRIGRFENGLRMRVSLRKNQPAPGGEGIASSVGQRREAWEEKGVGRSQVLNK